ncbi:group 1 truncated hemoglobin [uncultured Jatrophihabitans sp.]|uniref:group I truncated hemoglobin n=1 Tax=uncultured Jatrophihabitans sp. TaxID=1610747 RepID=UPI0035CA6724
MTLLDAIGGRSALTRLVDELYERICADPAVAGYFDGVDLVRVRSHMVDLLTAVAGDDPHAYHGRDMHEAHAALGITDDDFDRVASHIVDVLGALPTSEPLVDEVLERIAPLRALIVVPAHRPTRA